MLMRVATSRTAFCPLPSSARALYAENGARALTDASRLDAVIAADPDLAGTALFLHLTRPLVCGGLGHFLVDRMAEVVAGMLNGPLAVVTYDSEHGALDNGH